MTLMKVCACVRVFHEECVHAPRCLCVDVVVQLPCALFVCARVCMGSCMHSWMYKLVGANFRCCSPKMIILFYEAGSFTEK